MRRGRANQAHPSPIEGNVHCCIENTTFLLNLLCFMPWDSSLMTRTYTDKSWNNAACFRGYTDCSLLSTLTMKSNARQRGEPSNFNEQMLTLGLHNFGRLVQRISASIPFRSYSVCADIVLMNRDGILWRISEMNTSRLRRAMTVPAF